MGKSREKFQLKLGLESTGVPSPLHSLLETRRLHMLLQHIVLSLLSHPKDVKTVEYLAILCPAKEN